MELYEDTANNVIRFAAPYRDLDEPNDKQKVAIFEVDSASGNFVPGSRQDVVFNNSGTNYTTVHGLEFSPDGSLLYILHDPNQSLSSPLSVYNIAAQTLTNLSYTSISNFEKSQMQVSGDSANYTLWLASEDYIGGLFDPDSPSGSNWSPTAVPLNNYPTNRAGFPVFSVEDEKRLVPDQIDYENYTEAIFLASSCDCCNKYAYAGRFRDTTVTINTSATWSYGPSSNPWGALTGDTIFIRDYLKIPAGVNVTIDNMIFKFGPEARVIVERGTEQLNGGQLNLRNRAIFTADFRCSRRKYGCDDPTNNKCDSSRVWQGVRVEGLISDVNQSLSNQAYFSMDEGSMIEFAKTGILVGHESLADYGGGRISIKNSFLKDNITGIHFDPYTRLTGTSTELFNRSVVVRNEFTTTNDWLNNYLPIAHVDIDNSSGIKLGGNKYNNYNNVSGFFQSERGIGVKINDSRVEVEWSCSANNIPCGASDIVRSEFDSLYYGIYGSNGGTATRTLYSSYNIFKNTHTGTFLSSFINPVILDNDFNVKDKSGSVGLYLLSSTGYTVQNNNFECLVSNPNPLNYGILVSSSGSADNEIYRNYFTNLLVGGYAIGQNANLSDLDFGLHWICNEFVKPIRVADIYLLGEMSDDQGTCSNPDRPAGNKFSYSHQGGGIFAGHKDLGAAFGSTTNIVYSHHNTSGSPSNIVPSVYATPYYQTSQCPSSYVLGSSCSIDKDGTPQGVTHQLGSKSNDELFTYESVNASAEFLSLQLAELETQLEGNDDLAESDLLGEYNSLRYQYNDLWHEVTSFYMADTTGSISTGEMQNLLVDFEPENVERFASILLADSESDWISLQNTAQSSELSMELPVASADGLPLDIQELFESDFFASAPNANALNNLYNSNGAIYHPFIPMPEIIDAEEKSLDGNSDAKASKIKVQPNPFKDYITFDLSAYSFEGANNRLEFFDLLGKKVHEEILTENQVNAIIQGDKLPEGILLFTLYVNNIPVENGKVLKTK